MSRKHYKMLAKHIGAAFAIADSIGPEVYEAFYDNVYRPLSDDLKADNPNFDRERFSYACAVESGKAFNRPEWINHV